jgi:hypothetical protein
MSSPGLDSDDSSLDGKFSDANLGSKEDINPLMFIYEHHPVLSVARLCCHEAGRDINDKLEELKREERKIIKK